MTSRRRFMPEYKLEAANLVVKQQYSVRDAANAIGVGRSTKVPHSLGFPNDQEFPKFQLI